jgi:hypothetical protein
MKAVFYYLKGKTMNNDDNLVNICPFCKSAKAEVYQTFDSNDQYIPPFYAVECNECHARGPESVTKTSAILLWNMAGNNGG